MADRFQKTCRQPGCGTLTRDASGYCEKHTAHVNDARNMRNKMRMENDPVWELYGYRWTLLRKAIRAQGWVQCQRIINGVRCLQMADIYHHLWSPRTRPDLAYVPDNICGVCREHHPVTEGSPEWIANKDYIPTVMSMPSDFGREQS
jgi:hypothetical protein